MKIYLDYNIAVPAGFPYYHHLDQHIDEIPNDVDLIGLTFFHHDVKQIRVCVDSALEKSRYVIVYFCEFNGPEVANFEREYHEKYPNLQIFANAIPNYPSRLQHIGEWFMKLDNPYSNETWALDLLSRLSDDNHKSYKFDCLLGRQTLVRDFIADKYHKSNHRQEFLFSYFKNNLSDGIWNGLDISPDIDTSGRRIQYQGELVSISNILPVDIYNQSHYSIISDTSCPNEFSFYTEKVAKPLIAQRLFVAFGNHSYLKNLQKIGFRTFDGIIDESYDLIADDKSRWNEAWKQVEYLLTADPLIVKGKISKIVQHNQDLILTTDWASPIKQHIKRLALFP